MSFVSDRYKLIFIHVPKTGGRSINQLLKRFCEPEIVFNTRILDKNINVLGRKIAIEAQAIIPPAKWDTYFKVAFVRNPWDRAVSMYEHLRQIYLNYKSNPNQKRIRKVDFMQTILDRLQLDIADFSFELFVKKVLRDRVFDNYHWDKQIHVISDKENKVILDFIGRFETLHQDFDFMCQKTNIPPLELPHYNKSKRRNYPSYYTKELKEIVEDIYAEDIAYFDYRFVST